MVFEVLKGNITEQDFDVIVSGNNSRGYMGGFVCKHKRLQGVAEEIQYKTNGVVEKECKALISIEGVKQIGDVFITTSGGLKAQYIIHAVTSNKKGQKVDINTIDLLLPKVIEKARELEAKSVVIPLKLSNGIDKFDLHNIYEIYKKHLNDVSDIDIKVII